MLEDVGLVVLNYLTFEETEEMIVSFKKYYPHVRTLIVDNGSPSEVVSKLHLLADSFENTSVLALGENLGFAQGHNAGISKLREEGCEYICCSNSDIVFIEVGVLELLKDSLIELDGALAGPKILGPENKLHSPKKHRISAAEARQMYQKFNNTLNYRFQRFFKKGWQKVLLRLKLNKCKNKNYPKVPADIDLSKRAYVYQIRGAFLMMGKNFFKSYNGFDPNTFLYGEERILAEMLLLGNLKTIYVPERKVLHKMYKTSNMIWGSNKEIINIFEKESFNYWYKEYFNKSLISPAHE